MILRELGIPRASTQVAIACLALLGELDGRKSARSEAIKRALDKGGIPTDLSRRS